MKNQIAKILSVSLLFAGIGLNSFASDTAAVVKCGENFANWSADAQPLSACAGVKTDADIAAVVKCADNFASWSVHSAAVASCAGVKN